MKQDRPEETDKFEVSNGNLKVLTLIPEMMKISKYRKKLRMITLEYLQDYNLKSYAKRGFI
jgi:hypothetical protein